MTTIYVVQGGVSHEGTSVLCAFNDKEKADSFISKCAEYDKLKPISPKSRAPREEYIAWRDTYYIWQENHPAGYTDYDYYEIEEVELL